MPKVLTVNTDDCWLFAGAKNPNGYGRIYVDGKYKPAHRVLYEYWVAPIEEGLEPDHLCEVRACINPEHLEPVPHHVNTQRYFDRNFTGICRNGHKRDDNTSYYEVSGARKPMTVCRKCHVKSQTVGRKRRTPSLVRGNKRTIPLTDSEIINIRHMCGELSYAKIGRLYNVSYQYVSQLHKGRWGRHLLPTNLTKATQGGGDE